MTVVTLDDFLQNPAYYLSLADKGYLVEVVTKSGKSVYITNEED